MSDRLNMNLQDVRRGESEPEPLTVKHNQFWEIVGFFAMLAALLLALLVDREWGVFALLFAIYCAAMR